MYFCTINKEKAVASIVNLNLILGLFIHTSFGDRLLFAVLRGLFFSFDSPLDSHSDIVSESPQNVEMVLSVS